MKTFTKRYNSEICIFLAPIIAILLSKYMAGEYFLDYVLLAKYDTTIELSYLKLYVTGLTNHIFENPHMGAPLLADNNYWPWRNIGIGLYYLIISLFEKDLIQIYKIFYYSLFPISALTMFISLRYFVKLPNLISLGLSLIYAFMPFMFSHNIQHATVLVGVLCIPLVLGFIFYINFKDFKQFIFVDILKSKITLIIALILFISVTLSLFSAFYSIIILIFFLVLQLIEPLKDYNKIKLIFFLIGLNLLAILFNIYPHLLFKSDSHFTFNYMSRNFIHTTLYSVSFADFFIPVKNHFIDSFKFYSQLYSQGSLIKEFFNISYLGLFGIFSFLFSILYFFKRLNSSDSFTRKISFIGALIIFLLLMFARGGLMTTLYLYTDFLVLGSNYRITPWILCLSLMSGGIILNNLYNGALNSRFLVKELTERYIRAISILLFLVLVSFSLMDIRGSKPVFNKKDIPAEGSNYEEERAFFSELNKIITKNDMILQIPHVCFQETKNILGTSYLNTWSYILINKEVKFSVMSIRESSACDINSQLSSMSNNVAEMVKHAIYFGYTGLIVEKRGFIDRGNVIKKNMMETFGMSPLIDSTYLFYDIKELKKEFDNIRILPVEGDPLKSLLLKERKIPAELKKEIIKITQIFPSPCVRQNILEEWNLSTARNGGNILVSNNQDCNPKKSYNKTFFHFADDSIFVAPGVNMKNGLINLNDKFQGNVLSVRVGVNMDPGSYRVFINDNNGRIKNHDIFSITATRWGYSLPVDNELIFRLDSKIKATKLNPLVININKNVAEKNIIIRSVTIRKILEVNN